MSIRSSISFKKFVAYGLVALQTISPLAASAGPYLQMVPVKDLRVSDGADITVVDPSGGPAIIVGNAALKAAPAMVTFGNVPTGSTSSLQTLTLSNLGSGSAMLGTLSTNRQFSVSTECDGATLPALGSCKVQVGYKPTEVNPGGLMGTVVVPFTASGLSAEALIGMLGSSTMPSDPAQLAELPGFTGSDPSMTLDSEGKPQITFSPDGSEHAVSEPVSKTFVVSSKGNGPLEFSGVSLTDNDNGAFSVVTTCPALIPAGSSCTVTVTYTPGPPGTDHGDLTVHTGSYAGNDITIALKGTSAARAKFSLSTSQLNFGNVPVGNVTSQDFSVLNTGNVPLSTTSVDIEGAFFSVSHNCAEVLDVAQACDVHITFAPTTYFNAAGYVNVGFVETTTQRVRLDGRGLSSSLTVDTLNQNFGTVYLGATASRTYTLTNEGNAPTPLTFGSLPAQVTRSGDCDATLPGNDAVCHVTLTYAPTSLQGVNGSLSVAGAANTVGLGFTGGAQYAPSFELSTHTMDFGGKLIGSSTTLSFIITNTGQVAFVPPTFNIVEPSYALTTNCSLSLAPGASCAVSVTFTPLSAQSHPASLTAYVSGAATQTVTLTGTGQSADLGVNFPSQAFGTVSMGQSASLTYVVVNNGNFDAPLSFSGLAAPFSRAGTCSGVLTSGQTCTVVVTFTPTEAKFLSGTLTVFAPGTYKVLDFNGLGRGVATGTVTSSVLGFDYSSVIQNTSATKTFTVKNTGSAAATGVYVSAAGTAISMSANTCGTSGATITLIENASCTVQVTYAPTVVGPLNGGNFTAYGSFVNGPISTALTGSSATDAVYATWDPASIGSWTTSTLSNSNLTVSQASSGKQFAYGTVSKSSGKWYWEVTINSATGSPALIGISNSLINTVAAASGWAWGGSPQGYWGVYGTSMASSNLWGTPAYTSTGSLTGFANSAGAVYGFALDADTGKLTVYNNCTQMATISGLTSGPWKPQIGSGGNSTVPNLTANFGASPFACTVPAGFNLLEKDAAKFSLSTSTLAFGEVPVASTSQKTVQVVSTGTLPLTSPQVSTTGSGYTASHNCPATLGVGASCFVTITLSPTAVQNYDGTLHVSWSGLAENTVALSGAGQVAVSKVYATLDPAAMDSRNTLSNGNLTVSGSGSNFGAVRATQGKSTGKWYWEARVGAPGTNNAFIGFEDSASSLQAYPGGNPTTGFGYYAANGGRYQNGGTYTATAISCDTFNASHVIGFALDLDAGTLALYKNGVACGIGTNSFTMGQVYYPAASPFDAGNSVTFNFGASPFAYPVPSGFNAGWFN